MSTRINGEKVRGKFIKRLNRFEGLVNINGIVELVHIPNTGRMIELLYEGCDVILIKSDNLKRKTRYTMFFIYKNNHLVCINSVFANRVFEDAVRNNEISWLHGNIKREVMYKNSKFDFLVQEKNKTLVEIKCATYEENGIVMFPDAPTDRGRRHVAELMEARKDGYDAAIVILSFMDYVTLFKPYYKIDIEFGNKLKKAVENDVIFKVYRCNITFDSISISDEIGYEF